jgi:hypothetical protein
VDADLILDVAVQLSLAGRLALMGASAEATSQHIEQSRLHALSRSTASLLARRTRAPPVVDWLTAPDVL